MGRWPAQGDEKHFSSNYRRWKRRPPLCHLDRSSEGAQWRDLRCQRSFPGNVFRPGDEKRVLFSNYCRWKRRPPLCHLDRSAAQWRDLRCQRSFPWKTDRAYPDFLLRVASDVHVCASPEREPHADHQRHGSPQEIRGSVVERSAVSAVPSLGMFFDRAQRSGETGMFSALWTVHGLLLCVYATRPQRPVA
jgi:hypothetical protein